MAKPKQLKQQSAQQPAKQPLRQITAEEVINALLFYDTHYLPVRRLLEGLDAAERSPERVDELAIAAVLNFVLAIAGHTHATSALLVVLAALDDVAYGKEPERFKVKVQNRARKRDPQVIETIWRDWAASLLGYWHDRAGLDYEHAAEKLSKELQAKRAKDVNGREFDKDWIYNVREKQNSKRPDNAPTWLHAVRSESEAARILGFLVDTAGLIRQLSRRAPS